MKSLKLSVYIKGYHWPHILFFTLTPIVAIAGTAGLLWFRGIPWQTWVLAGTLFLACGFSITGGYHRLFAHKSYQARWPVLLLYLLFGAGAFEGSALWWACQHRFHHQYTDTSKDPYGINKGFWYAHIGWLFTEDQDPPNYSNVQDLEKDALVRFQKKFFIPLSVLMGFVLPCAIASLWGDAWGGLLVAGVARMVCNHHATFLINSLCHYYGGQGYSDTNSARDSWLAALLTMGEGFHNFHHAFQYDYRNGHRVHHWDPTKWFIATLARVGLAFSLKRARREDVRYAQLKMQEKRNFFPASTPIKETALSL